MACKLALRTYSSMLSEAKPAYLHFVCHSQMRIAVFVVALVTLYCRYDGLKFLVFNFSHTLSITSALLLICICIIYQKAFQPSPCYLVDFCCTKGEDHHCASADNFFRFSRMVRSVTTQNFKFQFKVFLLSGVGEEAYAPQRLLEKGEDIDMQDARVETQDLISDAARRVLQKTGVDPEEVDIVVVNCGVFNPTPSWTAFVVNLLNMRSDVKTFNLSGMGCSAGLIAIDLAKRLLNVHKNSYVLVVSTENITSNMYFGNDRSMMVTNSLFRCGSSAVLLTNKPGARNHAKLQLMHCVRTSIMADNKAYECVHHAEDDEGKVGVSLHASLVQVAGNTLRTNITELAPSILPWRELIKVAISLGKKRFLNKDVEAYEPNFKKAIDHFCIHPGGHAVLDSIGKGLKLTDFDIEPGRMSLERFGNTSSSGIWYALAYCEAKGRLKKGDKVWQIALGSGFKCNSGVWRVLHDIEPGDGMGCNPWVSSIDKYPVSKDVLEDRAAKIKDIDTIFARYQHFNLK